MLTIHTARYESLFYKYGWPLPHDVILLDGVEVAIGGELAAALRRLRNGSEERRIWIDAVCINQNNIAEKNEHVKMMGQIYSQASMVHVWLGEQYGDEEGALEAFAMVVKVFDEMAERTNGAMDEDIGEFQQRFFGDERVSNLDFAAVDELLRRTWVGASPRPRRQALMKTCKFERVWVIQEIAKAAGATIHIGPLVLDWEIFAAVLSMMQSFRVADSTIQSLNGVKSLALMKSLKNERDTAQEDRTFTLLDLVEETRHFGSTMPVDKIYAILGLVRDDDITVDYNARPEDVYQQFAVRHLAPQQNLDILCHCVISKEPRSLDLPSWVPDWTRPGYVEPFRIRDLRCNAAGDTPINLRIGNNGRSLFIKGRLIDTIAQIDHLRPIPQEPLGPEPNHRYPTFDNSRRVEIARERERAWMKNVRDFALPDESKTPPAIREAFWRTFMFNSTRYHEVPDAEACALGCDLYFETVLADKSLPQIRRERKQQRMEAGTDDPVVDQRESRGIEQFLSGFLRWGRYRRFFKSQAGRFGWTVDGAAPGDLVVVFDGGRYPMVLRSDGDCYTTVGDGYIHEFMNGEALEQPELFPDTEFHII
jgi:hypothetical protein